MKRFFTLIAGILIALPLGAIEKKRSSPGVPDSGDLIKAIYELTFDHLDFLSTLPWAKDCNMNKSIQGWTPLSMALHKRFFHVADGLVHYGASFHQSIIGALEYDNIIALLPLVRQVLTERSTVNMLILNQKGYTPLSYALHKNAKKCLQLLKKAPFHATIFDALKVALKYHNSSIVKELYTENPEEVTELLSRLIMHAIENENVDILSALRSTVKSALLRIILINLQTTLPSSFKDHPTTRIFSRDIALDQAIDSDEPGLLMLALNDDSCSPANMQFLLKDALEHNSSRCVAFLTKKKVLFIPLTEILKLVSTQNEYALILYVQEYCERLTTLDETLLNDLTSLTLSAMKKNCLFLTKTCHFLIAEFFIRPLIELDDLPHTQEAINDLMEQGITIPLVDLYEIASIEDAPDIKKWLRSKKNWNC